MSATDRILNAVSALLVGAGVLIALTFFLPDSLLASVASGAPAGSEISSGAQPNPTAVVENLAGKRLASVARKPRDARAGSGEQRRRERTLPVPQNKSLRMTIPRMARIEADDIPTARGTEMDKLHDHAAIHLEGTGFPWERNANVYMAGHRVGYPATDSFLAFYDLNKLAVGDRIFLTDARDRRYTYRVFRVLVVEPTNVSVTRPVTGRNILTLQTCTLPNYTQRLIVRAERISAKKVPTERVS